MRNEGFQLAFRQSREKGAIKVAEPRMMVQQTSIMHIIIPRFSQTTKKLKRKINGATYLPIQKKVKS